MKTIKKVNIMPSELIELIEALQTDISDDYRASEEDTEPSMELTIGYSDETGGWSYQTGDNSYTGGAYSYPHWGVVTLYRDSVASSLAIELIHQISDLINQ